MIILISFLAIAAITLLAAAITASRTAGIVLTMVVPYIVFAVFLIGFVYRIIRWAKVPVPFRIPTTCGQEKSLPWIKNNPVENPIRTWGVIGRMAAEIFLFRSLFRNSKTELIGGRPVYGSAKWLWFFGLMFHISLLVVILRHLRFFTEPVIPLATGLSALDGFLEIGIPTLYISDVALFAGLAFLFLRRVVVPQTRYISLFTDYFALLLIAAVAATGLLMRYFFPVDLHELKAMTMGWVTFSPALPKEDGFLLYAHLFFVFTLLAWLPFNKLMHMGGIFLSPTRNMANNNRIRRHVNPWNAPVKVHSYEEYENEFREQMKTAGLPVEKE
ncbi:MAG: sulfate reduction electron transfer complex DsrMKJOP subunit DsrM [Deltaproteobacteria bacterium]|nr:sulfate reduction electron transfer complex DsrMKJOP subunit DsrM [Deltaproteobacteria bacterium]